VETTGLDTRRFGSFLAGHVIGAVTCSPG